MAKFGERLRREREMRKVTLEEISAATKISVRNLRALEEEDFDRLPGGIFNKGFVRAYARFVGLSEDQAVADYMEAAGEEPPATSAEVMESLAAESERRAEAKKASGESAIPVNWKAVVALGLLIGIAAGAWFWGGELRDTYQRRFASQQVAAEPAPEAVTPQPAPPSDSEQPAAEAAPPTAEMPQERAVQSQPSPVPSNQPTPPEAAQPKGVAEAAAKPSASTPPAENTGQPIRLVVRATEEAYVEATPDDAPVRALTLQPGSVRTFTAARQLRLKVGNAAGVQITHNGSPIPPLGQTGQVKTVTFGPEGIVR